MNDQFAGADAALAHLYQRNLGSPRTTEFASFQDESTTPPLGVQLCVVGSSLDIFHSTKAAAPATAMNRIMLAANIKPRKRRKKPPRRLRRRCSGGLTGAVISMVQTRPVPGF